MAVGSKKCKQMESCWLSSRNGTKTIQLQILAFSDCHSVPGASVLGFIEVPFRLCALWRLHDADMTFLLYFPERVVNKIIQNKVIRLTGSPQYILSWTNIRYTMRDWDCWGDMQMLTEQSPSTLSREKELH